jgi:hypothetical protein
MGVQSNGKILTICVGLSNDRSAFGNAVGFGLGKFAIQTRKKVMCARISFAMI